MIRWNATPIEQRSFPLSLNMCFYDGYKAQSLHVCLLVWVPQVWFGLCKHSPPLYPSLLPSPPLPVSLSGPLVRCQSNDYVPGICTLPTITTVWCTVSLERGEQHYRDCLKYILLLRVRQSEAMRGLLPDKRVRHNHLSERAARC